MPNPSLSRRYRALDRMFARRAAEPSAIRRECLIAFPYEYPGRDVQVAIDTDEFTAVCPWTGLPDFGTLRVAYVPRRSCLELKSVKYYLLSYRSVGILQEHVANRILDDLVRACRPKRMTVVLDYKVRGGLHTVVTACFPRRSRPGSSWPSPPPPSPGRAG